MTRVSVVSLRGKRESNLRARVRVRLRIDGVIDTEPARTGVGVRAWRRARSGRVSTESRDICEGFT